MGKLAIEPSEFVARLLLKRRRELGLSLRQVQDRTEALGQIIPFTTLGKIERGQVEPGFKRLHLLLKVFDLPPQLAHELVELEQFAGETPSDRPLGMLYEEGVEEWKAGNLKEGLACLLAVRTRDAHDGATRLERQKTILSFAIAAGSLGRNRLSRQIVDELLLEPPEAILLVPVLIQASVCWLRLGSGDAALGFLLRAAECVDPTDLRNRAWIHHSRASTLASMGLLDNAETELTKTLSIYREASDAYGEGRALNARVDIRMDAGEFKGALRAAGEARAHADRHGFGRLSIVGLIHEGRALLQLGDLDASVASLRAALAESISTEDRTARFYAHFYLWKANEAMGEKAQAVYEYQSAQHYVGFTDEATPETNEIRATLATARRRQAGKGAP